MCEMLFFVPFCVPSTASGPPPLARVMCVSPALHTAISPPQHPTALEAQRDISGMTFNCTHRHTQV